MLTTLNIHIYLSVIIKNDKHKFANEKLLEELIMTKDNIMWYKNC